MNLRLLLTAVICAAALPAYAQQTGTVTVNVTGVHSGAGNILANLCNDPKAQFPGACATY